MSNIYVWHYHDGQHTPAQICHSIQVQITEAQTQDNWTSLLQIWRQNTVRNFKLTTPLGEWIHPTPVVCGSGTTIKKDQVFRNVHPIEQHFMCQRLDITEWGLETATSKTGNQKTCHNDAKSQLKLLQERGCCSDKPAPTWQQIHQTLSLSGNFLTAGRGSGHGTVWTAQNKLMTWPG
jgi:hypothetical protein